MNRLRSSVCAGALCLALILPAFGAEQAHFHDVPVQHWAYEVIEEAYAAGAIVGVGHDNYDPEGSLTQAQFMAILVRAVYPDEVEAQRTPEHESPWYAPELAVAEAHGLLESIIDPNAMGEAMIRYDMAAMLYDLLQAWGAVLPGEEALQEVARTIPDYGSVPAQYQTAVRTVFRLGLIMGMDSAGNFQGNKTMTRAHAAAVYVRLAHLLGLGVDVLAPNPEDYEDLDEMMEVVHGLTPLYRTGYLTNGKPINDENIAEFMAALEKKFPDGSPWTKRTTYQYSSPRLGQGRGEAAFAAMVSDWMFGEEAPVLMSRDYEAMKHGDILHFKNLDRADHYWVITGTSEDNYFGANGDANGVVSWKTFGGLGPLRLNLNNCGSMSSVVSRY